jgi:hypothetical protein
MLPAVLFFLLEVTDCKSEVEPQQRDNPEIVL